MQIRVRPVHSGARRRVVAKGTSSGAPLVENSRNFLLPCNSRNFAKTLKLLTPRVAHTDVL